MTVHALSQHGGRVGGVEILNRAELRILEKRPAQCGSLVKCGSFGTKFEAAKHSYPELGIQLGGRVAAIARREQSLTTETTSRDLSSNTETDLSIFNKHPKSDKPPSLRPKMRLLP